MKIQILLFALLIQYALSQPDYSDLNKGDFAKSVCRTKPGAYVQSPIKISNTNCQSYNVFAVQMEDVALTPADAVGGAIDPTIGAWNIPYTTASVTLNTTTWTSQYITFRTPSEHVLPQVGSASAAEIQIVMASGSQNAVLSFLVKNIGTGTGGNNTLYVQSPYYNVLKDFTATAFDFNLNALAGIINDKVNTNQFMNFYTYDGTLTYGDCLEATWFIYGMELYASQDVITAMTTLNAGINGGDNARPWDEAQFGAGSGSGVQLAARMCFTGFFNVDMGDNFGLWFGVVSILLFFIFTLSANDKPITDPDYEEDAWTHHPFVSIYKYGDELHTKKTRSALVLVIVTVNALFCSVFYRQSSNPTLSTNIIVFACYSFLIDQVVTFFVGNLLRRYYLAKNQFAKTHEESWEQTSQNRLFAYYIAIFVVVVVGWAFCIWNMGELHPEVDATPSKLWVASFFVALGIEFIVIYPIACLLAKASPGFRNLCKRSGFMFDHVMLETYMDYIKQE